jgi:hypothetical protein
MPEGDADQFYAWCETGDKHYLGQSNPHYEQQTIAKKQYIVM